MKVTLGVFAGTFVLGATLMFVSLVGAAVTAVVWFVRRRASPQ